MKNCPHELCSVQEMFLAFSIDYMENPKIKWKWFWGQSRSILCFLMPWSRHLFSTFALISISCRLFYCFALSRFPTENCGQKRNRVCNCFLPPEKEGAWRLWGRKFPFKLKTCPLVQIREFASGGKN